MTNVWHNASKLIKLYPVIVQDIVTPLFWKLKYSHIKNLYTNYTGCVHLDIGSGPRPFQHSFDKHISFLDVNQHVLSHIQNTYSHPSFLTHKGSLLSKSDYPNAVFDSISCVNVMHCIPDPNKWLKLFYYTHTILEKDGVLFGSVVLNNNMLSNLLNKLGIFHNSHDTYHHIQSSYSRYFKAIKLKQIGNCLVFVLRKI